MGLSAFDLSVLAGKTLVVLVVLLALYRLLGKRQAGLMNAFDLVTLMAVANAVQNAMTEGRGQLAAGIVSAATLVLGAFLITRLAGRSGWSHRLLTGEPAVLLSDGKILDERLRQQGVSREELQAALRRHGMQSPREAGMAVLEVDGSISVVPPGRVDRIDTDL